MRVLCVLALIFVAIATTASARPTRNDPEIIETNKKLSRLILKGDDFGVLSKLKYPTPLSIVGVNGPAGRAP